MKSIWNDRCARIAALLIVGGAAIGLALEVQPIPGAVMDIIGGKWTVLIVAGLLVAAVLLLFPGWWPLWRARRGGLSNAWVFALVTWGFSSVALETVVAVVLVPLKGFEVFFVPQLEDQGMLRPQTWRFVHYITEYWWMGFPLLQVFATVWVTRALARRWPVIDRAMRDGRDASVAD